jgi:PAS domain S-box-containing protein
MQENKMNVTHPDDIIKSLQSEIAGLNSEIQQLKAAAKTEDINKQSHFDYQESQKRFRTVFESSRLGNKIISSDLKIQQVNPAMVTLLGYSSKEDLIGTKIIDYSPADHKKHWQILQEKLWKKATPSFSLETTLIKKDGSIIWCQVTSILFQDKGETLGFTIIEDITEKHQLRLQKEEFISVASHELKTPLTSLKAGLQLLNRKIKNEPVITDKHISLAQSAVTHTSKLSSLVAYLLNSTKI